MIVYPPQRIVVKRDSLFKEQSYEASAQLSSPLLLGEVRPGSLKGHKECLLWKLDGIMKYGWLKWHAPDGGLPDLSLPPPCSAGEPALRSQAALSSSLHLAWLRQII